MNAAVDYAEHYDAVVEPRNIEVERGVKSLRDGGHCGRVQYEQVIDDMPEHPHWAAVVMDMASCNPVSPEGKRAVEAFQGVFDWAARRLVERELNRKEVA